MSKAETMGRNAMFKRIDHVEIVTPDLDKTIAFYAEVLGFKLRERRKLEGSAMQELAFLELGDTTIELMGVSSAAPPSTEPWQTGYRMMAVEVEDMDAAVEYLRGKGVELTRGPTATGRSKRAEINDPNGLSIELRQW